MTETFAYGIAMVAQLLAFYYFRACKDVPWTILSGANFSFFTAKFLTCVLP